MRVSLLIILITGLIVAFKPGSVKGQTTNEVNKDFGVGLLIGEPTGVSVKSWINNRSAFNIGAAWALADRDQAIQLHADFLGHNWFNNTENLAFYYGLGGRVIFADEATAGVRVPLGLNYVFLNIPFDLFVEAAPILDLTPDVQFSGNGGVGFRYYF